MKNLICFFYSTCSQEPPSAPSNLSANCIKFCSPFMTNLQTGSSNAKNRKYKLQKVLDIY